MKSKTPKPLTAAELISKARTDGPDLRIPNDTALGELRKLLEHNDSLPPTDPSRCTAEVAIYLLRSHGWPCRSRDSLRVVCRAIGRRSFSQS